MTQKPNDGFDPLDPIGTWRAMRDANLDAWSKGMAGMANTEAFAKMIGLQLDTMLAASAPMQEAVQQYMERYLAQAQMPSRQEVVSLAERMTSIEMRLDDMQSQMDELLTAVRTPAPAPAKTVDNAVLTDMQAQLTTILSAVQALPATSNDNANASEATPASPRRTRKPATKS